MTSIHLLYNSWSAFQPRRVSNYRQAPWDRLVLLLSLEVFKTKLNQKRRASLSIITQLFAFVRLQELDQWHEGTDREFCGITPESPSAADVPATFQGCWVCLVLKRFSAYALNMNIKVSGFLDWPGEPHNWKQKRFKENYRSGRIFKLAGLVGWK